MGYDDRIGCDGMSERKNPDQLIFKLPRESINSVTIDLAFLSDSDLKSIVDYAMARWVRRAGVAFAKEVVTSQLSGRV